MAVPKPRASVTPISLAQKTNRSIIEIPVTISGFIIGILVTPITVFLTNLFLKTLIPTAAAVPITVAISDDETASIRVFLRALIVALS